MTEKIKQTLKITLFAGVGFFLFWLVYRDMDLITLKKALTSVNYNWILLSLIIAVLSHLLRAVRWKMLITPLGKEPKTINTFLSVMIMYLVNLAIPRTGEVSRCGVLKKYEDISFTKLIGTVIIERVVDFILLVILALTLIISQIKVVITFIHNNPEVESKVQMVIQNPFFWIFTFTGFIAFVILIYLVKKNKRDIFIVKKIRSFLSDLKQGITAIARMEKKWLFISYSVMIYLLYFLMTYVVFYSFSPTANLGPVAGFAVFIMGSFGMVAPVQGGIGAYHFMAIETLFIYGIDRTEGQVFALLSHTSMTLMMIVLGALSIGFLPIFNKSSKKLSLQNNLNN